jgi:hypothetical protein
VLVCGFGSVCGACWSAGVLPRPLALLVLALVAGFRASGLAELSRWRSSSLVGAGGAESLVVVMGRWG